MAFDEWTQRLNDYMNGIDIVVLNKKLAEGG